MSKPKSKPRANVQLEPDHEKMLAFLVKMNPIYANRSLTFKAALPLLVEQERERAKELLASRK